jgi:hypothetical protein
MYHEGTNLQVPNEGTLLHYYYCDLQYLELRSNTLEFKPHKS